MVRAVLNTVRGRVPVIGRRIVPHPAGSEHTRRERLIEFGCDGILVSIPYENDAQYAQDVQAMADQRPPFLMLAKTGMRPGPACPCRLLHTFSGRWSRFDASRWKWPMRE